MDSIRNSCDVCILSTQQALIHLGEAKDGDDCLCRPHVQGLPTKHGLQEVITVVDAFFYPISMNKQYLLRIFYARKTLKILCKYCSNAYKLINNPSKLHLIGAFLKLKCISYLCAFGNHHSVALYKQS